MKKYILSVISLVLVAHCAIAGEVEYFNKPWEDIKAKARTEHKYILIDCYTDWCGWCKIMDKETMTNPEIIATINGNFIAVKMDMENGEGITMAMKYHVSGFPSFLFFSPEGNYVYRSTGYQKPNDFMKQLKGAMDNSKQITAPGFSGSLNVNYPDFYKNAFAGNGKSTFPKKEEVAAYLDKQKDLFSEENWAVMARFELDEKRTKFFLDNISKYKRLYGKASVDDKLSSMLDKMLTDAIKNKDNKAFDAMLAMAGKYMPEDAENDKVYYKIAFYSGIKDCDKYGEAMNDYVRKNGLDNGEYINTLCWDTYESCDDKKVLDMACKWMKEVTDNEPKYAYMDTYAALLFKAGNNKDAEIMARKAIEEGKKSGKKVGETEKLLQKITGQK